MPGAWPSAPIPCLTELYAGYLGEGKKKCFERKQNILFLLQGVKGGGGGSWVPIGKASSLHPCL